MNNIIKGSSAAAVKTPNPDVKSAGDPFRQTLTVFDMIVYGLISMVPIAPMAIYGNVFQASGGMPALAYTIGFLAVLFSVFSFGIMVKHFPSSGSIFTYASHIMGRGMGFITGWLMLLQYLTTPCLMYIIAGTALNGFIPAIPVWVWCLIFLALVAAVSLRGMKTTMVVNRCALIGELIILAIFIVMAIRYLAIHPISADTAGKAFFNAENFKFSDVMSSVSLAVLSYVGFGTIATLTQQAKNETQGPPKAMMIMSLMLVVLFAGQCYLATLVDPSGQIFKGNSNNGFYAIAKVVAGPWFSVACAVAVALSQGMFTALVGQTSISLVMFSMAKEGTLPKKLGTLKKGTNLPLAATVTVLIISLILVIVMTIFKLGMDDVAKISNFGALATYAILNACVLIFCWFQLKQRKNFFKHFLFPVLGGVICTGILFSLNGIALLVGVIWIVIGILYYNVGIKNKKHTDSTAGDKKPAEQQKTAANTAAAAAVTADAAN